MSELSPKRVYLSIDVGTGSVRAGIFDCQGKKLAYHSHTIKTRNQTENHYEQSSDDIWRATKHCIRTVTNTAKQDTTREIYVASIGVDATCSLVACKDDDQCAPLSVVADDSETGDSDTYNIILWLDHRAMNEADEINRCLDKNVKEVRSHFGNVLSPENEPPKLVWLQKHKPEIIQSGVFFDLADWMVFQLCRNRNVRSSCTVACKWGWGSNGGNVGRWNPDFWRKIGLETLSKNGFEKIGSRIIKPGASVGTVAADIADELGLSTECAVASPMIDAHAGSLWTLGIHTSLAQELTSSIEDRLSVIAGTSTCFIQISKSPIFVSGVWGPFRDAILPGFHVTEGGQSVTGKLLEDTVKRHPCFASLCERVGSENVYPVLEDMTESVVRRGEEDPATHVHCLDYHAGNRSPRADPYLRGMMTGLSLSDGEYDLAVKFRATMQALCYGARHIVQEIKNAGHKIKLVAVCGGLCKSRMFLTELADCLSIPVVLSSEEDTVLLGGAILARVADTETENVAQVVNLVHAAEKMANVQQVILPNRRRKPYHDRKYLVYQKMYSDFVAYKDLMNFQTT
ncbi:FGGY carbohydrate kinase domain containing protein [Gracilaria domingensis]|nr:FGGY carbohydrate kinase domain containing protein [Gracilaria domingensis]